MAARATGLVTLTGDLGDAYAAQVQAVLYAEAPRARVVVLDVGLRAHGIEEAGFLLEHLTSRFPPGTVHLAVVDPGVGGRRAAVAVRVRDGSYFVGPDNGLLDRAVRRAGVDRAVRLEPGRRPVRPRVGRTFDGRDLFAPAAAALARGRSLGTLGPAFPYR